MRKVLVLFMVFLLLLTVFSGCKEKTIENAITTSDTTSSNSATTESLYDDEGYLKDNIPEATNFNNEVVNVLSWKIALQEFYTEGESGDLVNNALYYRLRNVESRLNVSFNITYADGNFKNASNFISKVEQADKLGADGYDIIASYSGVAALGAMRGFYLDLAEQDYPDFSMPWWPDDLVNSISINDKLYFASGDISTHLIYGLFAVYVNNDLLEQINATYDPYELALSGGWTIEKMMEISKDIYIDNNLNDTTDNYDTYGFIFCNSVSIDPLLQGSGINIVTKNDDGELIIDPTLNSEKSVDLISKMCQYVSSSRGVYINSEYCAIFPDGNALFMMAPISVSPEYLTNCACKYGVVPIPKYDDEQESYITTMNHNFSMFSIARNTNNPEMSATVIEALASEGYRTVSPVIFETAFQVRYSENETISQMYDLIRDGLKFDIGRLYRMAFATGTVPDDLFRDAIRYDNANWNRTCRSYASSWSTSLKDITDTLTEIN